MPGQLRPESALRRVLPGFLKPPRPPHEGSRFMPLRRLARWWQGPDTLGDPAQDPLQLMWLWECWGRPHGAALGIVLLMNMRGNSPANGLP